jgi:FtsZ-interacting cell division protein ZipA
VDSGQLVWIIVGIVVVLAIVAVVINLSRKRKTVADRNRAAEMREKAEADQLAAREHEAKAARADADAKAAEVEAERLRRQALGTQQEAETVRAGAQEQLRKADEVDPDVVTGKHDDGRTHDATHDAHPHEAQHEELRRDRGDRARQAGTGEAAGAREDTAAERRDTDGPHGERPRNL